MKPAIVSLNLLFLSTILTVGCVNSSSRESKTEVPSLPTAFSNEPFSLSEIATDMIFIPLSSEVAIPPIRRIDYLDSIFYIIPNDLSKLYRFNSDGKFLDVFDNKGQGPGEYYAINNFHVFKNGDIYIHDGAMKSMKVYDKELNYTKTIPYPDNITHGFSYCLGNKFYLIPYVVDISPEYDWAVMNTSGLLIDYKLNPYAEKTLSFSGQGSLLVMEDDNALYVYKNYSDTIFRIDENGYAPAYYVNRTFDDGLRMLSIDEIFLKVESPSQIIDPRNSNGRRKIAYMYKADSILIIAYSGQKSETVIFNTYLNTAKVALVDNIGMPYLPDTWAGSGNININRILSINGEKYIVSIMDAYKLKEKVQSQDFINNQPEKPDLKERMIALSEQVSENDNPILVLFRLK